PRRTAGHVCAGQGPAQGWTRHRHGRPPRAASPQGVHRAFHRSLPRHAGSGGVLRRGAGREGRMMRPPTALDAGPIDPLPNRVEVYTSPDAVVLTIPGGPRVLVTADDARRLAGDLDAAADGTALATG